LPKNDEFWTDRDPPQVGHESSLEAINMADESYELRGHRLYNLNLDAGKDSIWGIQFLFSIAWKDPSSQLRIVRYFWFDSDLSPDAYTTVVASSKTLVSLQAKGAGLTPWTYKGGKEATSQIEGPTRLRMEGTRVELNLLRGLGLLPTINMDAKGSMLHGGDISSARGFFKGRSGVEHMAGGTHLTDDPSMFPPEIDRYQLNRKTGFFVPKR